MSQKPHSGLRNPVTSEIEYTKEELDFMLAMDRYKRCNGRPYPTWREVLMVLSSLGYRKVAQSSDIPHFTYRAGSKPKEIKAG